MRVATVIGARPQFVKAAAVSRRLREKHQEILIHTGQHYDDGMSEVFFRELDIPVPEHELGVGSGAHGAQTGRMLAGIEQILLAERPDWVLVYGDTNSTLAGALAAAKLNIAVAHVEAGLRSFNRRMPEELNRVLTDHVSRLLLCPSDLAVHHLAAEGIQAGVHVVGDVMVDSFTDGRKRAERESSIHQRLAIKPANYWLVTVHRAENTDDLARLETILSALHELGSADVPVIFAVHPRTRNALNKIRWEPGPGVRMIEPVGYLDMIALEVAARGILTDSGGVQKEAYWASVPCTTLRDQTEWTETLEGDWNVLVGADSNRILATARRVPPARPQATLYGTAGAAARVIALLEREA